MQLANKTRQARKFKLCIGNRRWQVKSYLLGAPVIMVLDGWVPAKGQIAATKKQKKIGGGGGQEEEEEDNRRRRFF